ncbi:MAG TPA: DNA-directed RNA polymerase subunit omega [Candidatus Limnocylindria bacterium]|jgi:DNA-directed RNA polymerase subunit omega|nr:DNA-directed RNA polymerase subunit omega [Candidatus Limnocylindria bacterium]
MNIELTKRALEKVGNAHVLVNLVSRRVRQLNSGGGGLSRPLVEVTPGMGAADIALLELIEEKIGWENFNEGPVAVAPAPKRRKRAAAAA